MPFLIATAGSGVSGGGGTTSPGGSDTQVQFNDGGSFGGNAGLVFNKTSQVLTVGGGVDPSSVRGLRESGSAALPLGTIADGQYLRRVGSAIVGATVSSSSTNASGINQSIQFNTNGNFDGSRELLWDSLNRLIMVSGISNNLGGMSFSDSTGILRIAISPNSLENSQIIVRGSSNNNGFFVGLTNESTNRVALNNNGLQIGNGVSLRDSFLTRNPGGGLLVSTTATSPVLHVSGVALLNQIEEIFPTSGVTIAGVQLKGGVVEFDAVRGVRESGGSILGFSTIHNGQFLMRSGNALVGVSGSLGGGAGTPGGSNTQIQYNSAGNFAGSANLVFDAATNTMTLTGEHYIIQEAGHSATTPSLRVRDSSNNDLWQIQGDGAMHNLRGTIVPVYRDPLLNSDLNINTTTAADRTYLFLAPISGDRNLILRTGPETGRSYVVEHIGTGNVLNVRGSVGGTIIVAVAPQFSALVVYDGVNWVNIA